MEKDIEALKQIADRLLIETALTLSHQKAMVAMISGVYRETLGDEATKAILVKFYDLWEQKAIEILSELSESGFSKKPFQFAQMDLKDEIQILRDNL
jgi:hypothetical protein